MDKPAGALPDSLRGAGRFHHAVIVTALDESAQYRAARELAAAMLCERAETAPCGTCRHCRKVLAGVHPDVVTLERQADTKGKKRREIYVDQIRALAADVIVRPNEAERKVYIVREADTMNIAAQNAFLKLLEEPPPYAAFLLCAGSEEHFLPTVRSRCSVWRAPSTETPPDENAAARADAYLAAAAGGAAALLRQCALLEKLDAAAFEEFIRATQLRVCDMLCGRADARGLDREALFTQEKLLAQIEKYLWFHVGVRHLCGLLATASL